MSVEVVVVGGGHAGIEAALVAARMGCSTVLVTDNPKRIGYMSCNPSIGGLGKGHIVKEIDVLGGEMARAADATCIMFKRLNERKGPAVRGSRAQCDKDLYMDHMAQKVATQPHLRVVSGEVKNLLLAGGRCVGVVLDDGSEIESQSTVLATGTFMRAVMHIGFQKISGGRVGDRATSGLSEQLAAEGFSVNRLKTGTPPRLLRQSIDWSKTTPQGGDKKYIPFSFTSEPQLRLAQIECFSTYTNERTHEIIRSNLDKSPMFCGVIEGIGPRYCPSVEDKVTRFADKENHLSFLEPEGLTTDSIYLQGLSTSLPEEVQYEFLRTIPGLENVKMIRPGYAVEYDFFEPTQLLATLETKAIHGLFFAGQINGTSGYEEAAGQGLIAGLNAALKARSREEVVLGRDQAYIGVLIDDLVTKGTREPYRMMTSRAEHRLLLREDNAIERLGPLAVSLGVLSVEEAQLMEAKLGERKRLKKLLAEKVITPNQQTVEWLRQLNTQSIQKPTSLEELLRRPELDIQDIRSDEVDWKDDADAEAVEIAVKYSGYISRHEEFLRQSRKLEQYKIPSDLDYAAVKGLSREEVEKLNRIRPWTLGQAERISGVNPSAVQALLVHMKGRSRTLMELSN